MKRVKALDRAGGRRAVGLLKKKDPQLCRIIEQVGELRLQVDPAQSVFDALCRSIIYQQLSGKAAATIHQRFRDLFAGSSGGPTAAAVDKTPDAVLRGAGVSNAKVAALKDLARKELDAEIPDLQAAACMSDEEIIAALVRVRGVGVWTAQMFLIFRLGRPDVMPSTDYGIRKGFALVRSIEELPAPSEIDEFASEHWAPYRSVASWYLWRSLELN